MKNKLLISNLRKIKSSYKRFISLMCMALLGVGFYAGIKATSPNMLKTLDNYLDEQNVYDLEIVSTLGLTDDDINKINELGISDKVVGIKSIDEIIELNKLEKIIKVSSVSDINKIILKEGNLPKKDNEIVVEQKFLKENKLSIGDTISINNDNLVTNEFIIVGTIESPLYFSSYRGTTNVGNGELNYYTYVLESAFKVDYYTNIYLTLNDTKNLITNSDSYLNEIEESKEKLESIKRDREQVRFNELYQDKINYMESLGLTVNKKDFPSSTWYIFDRSDNQGYTTFIDATESMKQIGTVFPLVFYVVAILISLISMTRMVMEDRTEIGTLKGLGFYNYQIASKYLTYSFLATVIGGTLGMLIGFSIIPRVIWSIYKALFTIPTFICNFEFYYGIIGLLVAVTCICGSSIIASYTTLKDKPSELMRPKAPKIGKKIFLEKITFIWEKLSFSAKITIRNIFRYKKRVLVTIIGIAGSTSLILVGFGLKDSVTNVAYYNYNNVFVYDKMITLKNNADTISLMELLKTNDDITSTIKASYEVVDLYNFNKDKLDVNLIVPEDESNFSDVIRLNDINNDKKVITLKDNYIALSEKLALTLKVKVGDKVLFKINDNYKEVEISNIVENYVRDYAYMTKNTYENLFETYNINTVFIKNNESYDNNFDKKIIKNENVSNLISKDVSSNLIENVLSSLNSVVVVLIVSSAILAFVILYNLSNINISERKREISTLKVLGFYDEEVDAYITRENYFITIIGIAIGLYIGLYLSHYIISTCEPEFIMFIREIKLESYIISALISLIFTIIVNIITHINLKKIDMVESLKSNE